MKKLTFTLVYFAVAALLLTACSQSSPEAAVEPVISQPVGLIAEGRLLPVSSMDQSFSIPGQVAEVLVRDGDPVQNGQVLARLADAPDLQTALARARQELLSAQQALNSLQAAAEANLANSRLAVITAQNVLEDAQDSYDTDETEENQALVEKAAADLKVAEAALRELEAGDGIDADQRSAAEARLASAEAAVAGSQAALEALELKSSLSGSIVDLTLQAGERVSAGLPILTVADYSSWVIKTDNLTEAEVVNVEIGQKVNVLLDALPNKPLAGEVTHINARFEEKRGDITYTVTVLLAEIDPLMRWGMTAAVQFAP